MNPKPRILLLLPTRTYRATDFLAAARQLDVDVVIGCEQPQTLADLSPQKSLTLNFHQPERATQRIVAFAEAYQTDAIIGVDDDTTILATMAAERLSLPHNSLESAYATRDKYRLRKALADAGLLAPPFHLFLTNENPAEIAAQVSYPCVLKPLSLSASRGVIRADNPAEFAEAFHRIIVILQLSEDAEDGKDEPQQVLVEGFIPGVEVALEGLVSGGVLKVLAIFDKPDPLDGPFFEETLYITPSRLPSDTQAEIAATTSKAIDALGLKEGPVHAELRLNDCGVWLIEIAARSIGGLCSRTLRFGTGISLEELIIRHAVGMDVDTLEREGNAAGVMMIPIPYAGILREVRGKADAEAVERIEEVTITIPLGQVVVPLPEGTRYLGFIFARGETPESVEAALRESHRRLEFVIQPAGRSGL
jgi:biotin carboxylase